MMRLGELVATSRVVAATSKRTEKRAALAELLAGASPTEIEPLVGMLTGDVRQGALGTGCSS